MGLNAIKIYLYLLKINLFGILTKFYTEFHSNGSLGFVAQLMISLNSISSVKKLHSIGIECDAKHCDKAKQTMIVTEFDSCPFTPNEFV